MALKQIAKGWAKWLAKAVIYRFPPVFLSSAGLYLWFDEIKRTEGLGGAIIEVGCYLGATSALGARFLYEIGSDREYYAVDTFGGFVGYQFESELAHGGVPNLRHHFSANDPALARWVIDRHGGKAVKIVVGDITTLPEAALPTRISACLLDIDLAEPIYHALVRLYPLLLPGGGIVVDDCDDATLYKAIIGYKRFVSEIGLPVDIRFGKGLIRKPAA